MSLAAFASALWQTLHSITGIKIAELDEKRTSVLALKEEALGRLSRSGSSRVSAQTRTIRPGKDLADLRLSVVDPKELVNVTMSLLQAEYDPSVPQSEIARYEEWLKSCMEYHNHRLEYAKLFSSVLSQHLHYHNDTVQQEVPSPLDESFELLEEDRLRQLRDKFEDVVFNKVETDENEIQEYLESLFPTEELKNIIEGLRNCLKNDTMAIFEARNPFDDDSLGWIIRGLLHNDPSRNSKKRCSRVSNLMSL
ncbi:hypothetical protein LTR70_008188 [Exophiala xenobiotica]|uniref:Uncharacterized protein n=1 Tax=Lithohypha guttulata TaxID=1690604 RepID=A0ABR0K1B7_9EURO|nr:hypothetical protein LTR24_007969 [Lithohypha guttulata]KAK5312418.1 hypothetical protein LTR70_008188 [Exophiala xenobiotica]